MRFSTFRSAAAQAALDPLTGATAPAFAVPRKVVPTMSHLARGAAFLALVSMSLVAYAFEPPYNPDHLTASEVLQVGEICQKVMGLQPSESLTDNLWPGDPDPASETNDYRGCIATLSNSLTEEARSPSKELRLASLGVTPFLEQPTTDSPNHVPPGVQREQLACAEIGLKPNQLAFADCVQGLRDVLSASFMVQGYRN